MQRDEHYERGVALRREMFGPAGAEQALERTTHLNDKLQEMVTRWCFGDVWQREGLTPRERSMLTIGMLLALNRRPELETHYRGALSNGLTPEQLREICLHAVVYCGLPAGVEGIRVLDAVLRDVAPDAGIFERAAGEPEGA